MGICWHLLIYGIKRCGMYKPKQIKHMFLVSLSLSLSWGPMCRDPTSFNKHQQAVHSCRNQITPSRNFCRSPNLESSKPEYFAQIQRKKKNTTQKQHKTSVVKESSNSDELHLFIFSFPFGGLLYPSGARSSGSRGTSISRVETEASRRDRCELG